MRSRPTVSVSVVSLTIVALALAGCGTEAKTVTVNPPYVHNHAPPPAPTSVTYTVPIGPEGSEGTPPGQPGASGTATISVNASTDELCWKISNLAHVTKPTVARIYRFAPPRGSGAHGFKLYPHYRSSGCVPENLIFLGLLGAQPQEFWLSIHTAKYPAGAARAHI